jgi:hypothetical protein
MRATLVPTVAIDIKPGSPQNVINLKDDGLVSVGILATSSFNVAEVQADSVRFADAKPDKAKFEDVNEDGLIDLVLRFPVQKLRLTHCSTQGTLVGRFNSGSLFIGADSVVIKDKD